MALKETDKTVAFDQVVCLKATPLAMLCLIDGDEHWIPKSHVHDDSEVFNDSDNKEGKLVISEWIAIQKKLV